MERVEWIDDLDMRIFRARGIVGVDGLIRTSTVSSLPADSRPTVPGGFIPATPSSYPCTYSVASSAVSLSPA
jgi:hypothetical protein